MYDYWRIDTSLIDNEWHVDEIEKKNFNLSNLEKAINYSFNLIDMWVSGDLQQKRKLQRMVFLEGIEYDHENDVYRTFRTNAIFDLISSLSVIRKHKKTGKFQENLKNSGLVQRTVQNSKISIQQLEQTVKLVDPQNVLKRGYSITLIDGKLVTDLEELKEGQTITTTTFQGTIESQITRLNKRSDGERD